VGQRVLARPGNPLKPRFVKVMPKEYKQALARLAEEKGRDSNTWENLRDFMEHDRELPQQAAGRRTGRRFQGNLPAFSRRKLRAQAARCMDCGVPTCHAGCPLGNRIPDWNDEVYRGRWKDALHQLLATNNFPEFTGRLCPAPCEEACVLAINAPAVTIEQIEKTIIEQRFRKGLDARPRPPLRRTARRVAVIGSGPAGLACAQQLNTAGHTVTVFERDPQPGGLLRYGIPDFKLEKSGRGPTPGVDAKEKASFLNPAFMPGWTSPEMNFAAGFDAVVICCGATHSRDLPIPGRELSGIHQAMVF
jgi:glutamate synthase (NADPH/NADH) small chain